MRAVIKRPGSSPDVIEIENTLEALQSAVGGYIEAVTVAKNAVIICDEEGLLKMKPRNVQLFGIRIYGTFLIVGTKDEDFCDVPDEEGWLDILDRKDLVLW